MRRGVPVLLLASLLLAALETPAQLDVVRAEPNLEKRSRKALAVAESKLEEARNAYKAGDWEATLAALKEVDEAVRLSLDSLKQTGKRPRRHFKHVKHGELKTRAMVRKLDDFLQRMSVDEREQARPVREAVQKVHDEFLGGVMGTEEWKTP